MANFVTEENLGTDIAVGNDDKIHVVAANVAIPASLTDLTATTLQAAVQELATRVAALE
jgi:hypothetical protein